jgi:hypothetical protein
MTLRDVTSVCTGRRSLRINCLVFVLTLLLPWMLMRLPNVALGKTGTFLD